MIVIGGSLKNAWNFYKKAIWDEIKSFPYQRAAGNLKIEVSALENAGIFGAASTS
jgi:glucokinase